MTHRAFKVLSALACAVLAGCASRAPIAEPPPKVDLPAGWSVAGAPTHQEWPDKNWWQRFGSAELTHLVDEGQSSNLELAGALARVKQAEAEARIAGVSLLPTANFYGDANRAVPIGSGSPELAGRARARPPTLMSSTRSARPNSSPPGTMTRG